MTFTRSWGVDTEPESMLDAEDEVVPIAKVVSGKPVTSKMEAMSVIVQRPAVGADAVMADQVVGSCRADVLVSVARALSMPLTLPSGSRMAVRNELVPMVVMVVVTPEVRAVVTSMMLTPAGGEVCDSRSGAEATTPVMATRLSVSTEGNVTDGEELVFSPEALVKLVVAWLSGIRDPNVVCPVDVIFNVSVPSGDALSVRSLPAICSDNRLADE